ncbi:ABC transporter permease subunit [Luteibacter sp. ME-Dv--P-043b]|uniref:ABC transporter permease n=1 Tax=Luteibacter sp. ME-Dv--P-043b TaxID=3040291 RepID=UPI002555EEFA|nr:ABC transporter permease subunit [Luteibacter sp. ME-Dv--P-043b]
MTVRGAALPVIVLTGAGALAAVFADFLHVAPNRLLSGPAASPHVWALAAVWLLAGALGTVRVPGRTFITAVLAWAGVVGLPLLAGMDARALLEGAATGTRIQLGTGFWVMWLAATLLLLDRLAAMSRPVRVLAWVGVPVALAGMAMAGTFDSLALLREYAAQHAPFAEALLTHVLLAAATLAIALPIGAPLGWWAWRTRRTDGALVGVLAFLQTVPSLALFALLIGPFAWLAGRWPALGALGFGGTGAAPAVFALVLYALLPVVRYTVAGLDATAADTREAARGLGMTRRQVLLRVQLPLGWPVLLAGLRIVAVQTVGLAAVAALIGAGGLGRFVFLGIGQGATDMVLLGTLTIIALALAVDLFFQSLLVLTERPA